jgi:hypothetical protein
MSLEHPFPERELKHYAEKANHGANEMARAESVVHATVIEKAESEGEWSIVPFNYASSNTHSVKIILPNGKEKWIGVSTEQFNAIDVGEEIAYELEPWEDESYTAQLQQAVERAHSFDELKAGLGALDVMDERQRYSIDNIVEDLNNIEQGTDNAIAIRFLPDIPGLKEKLVEFTAVRKHEADRVEIINPDELSDDDLLAEYRTLQERINDFITKRDALDQGITRAHVAKQDLTDTQERLQRRIEDGFEVLGRFRDVIDGRGLLAKGLGDLDH